MKKIYNLQFRVAVDDAGRQAIINQARKYYAESGGVSRVTDDGTEEPVSAEEQIETTDDALWELIHTHSAFDGEHVELLEMSCDTEESAEHCDDDEGSVEATLSSPAEHSLEPGKSVTTEASADDDLDSFEADVYLCRWPNGEFSVVTAPTRRLAIIALDEWAGAHPSQLYPMDSFMADFRLTDEGEIVFNQFGEETSDAIGELCYPELTKTLMSDNVFDLNGEFKPGGRERILEAVKHERTRLWENQPRDEPRTELGKKIAERMRTSAVVADHYVDEIAGRILESDEGENGKPN